VRVAILHNPRPDSQDPALPDDTFEEYDSAETISAIRNALAGLKIDTAPVVADEDMVSVLKSGGFDFVFNIAEGAGRRCREAVPAAVCELLGLPYTGSDPLTLAVTLDKSMARRIVSPDVRVARGVLVEEDADREGLAALRFPVLVKPNDEGSSKGIRHESLCHEIFEAVERTEWLRARYGCPALVEEFLPGAEITVGLCGNGSGVEILGLMEIAPTDELGEPFIYSIEMKRDWRRRVRYYIPPRLPPPQTDLIRDYALTAWRLLGCRDFARIDFRIDRDGRPAFLECNALPGLNPENSDLVIMLRQSLSYDQLVQGILLDAARRHGMRLALSGG
jgi:D-alanine-D-alanine ligase